MPKIPRNGRLDKPDVRLAYGAHVCKTVRGLEGPSGDPTVRLALSDGQAERNGTLDSPTVRLVGQSGGGMNTSILPAALSEDLSGRPALLVSYVYLEAFLKNRGRYHYRDWALDSGAFSAYNSGTEIKPDDYTACCKDLLSSDPKLAEVFALDVIGDWRGSLRNTERMWRKGVGAIPCFHYGEPWSVLLGLCKDYPKVAIGGCVGKRDKDKFAAQCFARVWPKALHGFGFGGEKSLFMHPWHSVDATNWEIGPCKFGRWNSFGGQTMSVRGSKQNLRAEVEWYLELERRARERWSGEMGKIPRADTDKLWPNVRLAINGKGQGETNGALGPTIRLARSGNITTKHGGNDALAAPVVRLVAGADDVTERRPTAFSRGGKQ